MELYADRLAKLAGLPAGTKGKLNEASNRSYHDGDSGDDPEFRHGKGQSQLAEGEHGDDPDLEEDRCFEGEEKEEGAHKEPIRLEPEVVIGEVDDDSADEGYGHSMEEIEHQEEGYSMDEKHDDDLVEINEEMLAEEIARMRQERLEENQLRSIIKKEIASVVKSLQSASSQDNSNKPDADGITMSFPGPGFR